MPADIAIKRAVQRYDADIAGQYGDNCSESIAEKTKQTIYCHNYTMSEYYLMVKKYFGNAQVWSVRYVHEMKSSNDVVEFFKSTALRPYFEILNEKERIKFVKIVCEEMEYKAIEDGTVLFEFPRIFIIAQKKLGCYNFALLVYIYSKLVSLHVLSMQNLRRSKKRF